MFRMFYFFSFYCFFFNDTATTEIYTLSLHDALPICHSDFFDSHSCRSVSRPNRSFCNAPVLSLQALHPAWAAFRGRQIFSEIYLRCLQCDRSGILKAPARLSLLPNKRTSPERCSAPAHPRDDDRTLKFFFQDSSNYLPLREKIFHHLLSFARSKVCDDRAE